MCQYTVLVFFFLAYFTLYRLVGSPCSPRDLQESSPTPQFKSINSSMLSFLYTPTLTSIHDYWKNHSLDQKDLCWQSNVSAFQLDLMIWLVFLLSQQIMAIWVGHQEEQQKNEQETKNFSYTARQNIPLPIPMSQPVSYDKLKTTQCTLDFCLKCAF